MSTEASHVVTDIWPASRSQGVGRGRPACDLRGSVEAGDVCPGCDDHPYLGYSEVSPRLQRIRGPYTLEAGVAAYAEHLGLATSRRRS